MTLLERRRARIQLRERAVQRFQIIVDRRRQRWLLQRSVQGLELRETFTGTHAPEVEHSVRGANDSAMRRDTQRRQPRYQRLQTPVRQS